MQQKVRVASCCDRVDEVYLIVCCITPLGYQCYDCLGCNYYTIKGLSRNIGLYVGIFDQKSVFCN